MKEYYEQLVYGRFAEFHLPVKTDRGGFEWIFFVSLN
jgi:hypothetical protein